VSDHPKRNRKKNKMNLSTQTKSFHILNLSTIAAFLSANGDRDGEVYNLLTEAIGEGFTWGDTDHTLVHIGSFLEYFPVDIVFGSPTHKLLYALDEMIDKCSDKDLFFIDLEK
jgi:hypothetical protein